MRDFIKENFVLNTILFLALGCLLPINTNAQTDPEHLLLKNYRPESLFNITLTKVEKAKYPVIDVHSHPWDITESEIKQWVKTMDEVGIQKTIILSKSIGSRFDSIYAMYSKYPEHFEVWCGFDYTGYDKPGYGSAAVAELERCVKMGATGVGELSDKGKGLFHSNRVNGMHIDDPRMDPLIEKCGDLGIPINIHVGEPLWFYKSMDSTNDGLMNAYYWRLDNQKNIVSLAGMIEILERAVKKHPNTIFIACHLANLNHDLNRLGVLLDKYPNLYADISARYAESAAIPRFAKAFYEKYQDKLLYGTDLGTDKGMYQMTFRMLESNDEHFYYTDEFQYHWPLSALNLDDETLEKIYGKNASKILNGR